MRQLHRRNRWCGSAAFTLIEVLIVVVILGILATIVMINVSTGMKDAQAAVLRDELQFMRTQISLYRATHSYPAGVSPGDGSANAGTFVSQMTNYTDSDGNVSASQAGQFKYGIYLSQMPANPINGKSDIKVLGPAEPLVTDGTTGWLYKPETVEFCANVAEYGPAGLNW